VTWLSQNQGWMAEHELAMIEHLARLAPLGPFLELGTWKGLSTSAIASVGAVVCVDTFQGTRGEGCEGIDTFADFLQNMDSVGLRHRVIVLRCSTDEAIRLLHGTRFSLGLVDADHHSEQVSRDLAGVWDLLVSGGFLLADDVTVYETVAEAWKPYPERGRVGKLAWAVKP